MNEYGKDSNDITVKVGDRFSINLETMSASGYVWKHRVEDTKKLKFIKEDFFIKNTNIGSSSYSKFIFQAIKKGKTFIEINYLREWESKIEEKIIFSIKIE